MKKLFYLSIMLLLCKISFAQFDTINLSQFKLPEVKRHSLDLNFNMNGSYNYEKYTSLDEETNKTLSSYLSPVYNYYRNSAKWQQNSQVYFNANYYKRSDRTASDTSKYTSIGFNFSTSTENRYYFSQKMFFEFDLNLSYYKSNYKTDYYESDYETLDLKVPVGIGYGRIEPVHDARLAIYILDELNKEGRLSRQPSNEEIHEFADLIAVLTNERFFDHRLQKIKELEQVDAFLKSKGLVENNDIRYFAIVNDNWDYGQSNTRYSGFRVSVGLAPVYNYYKSKYDYTETDNKDESKRKSFKGRAFLKLLYEKPTSLTWQHTFSLGIDANTGNKQEKANDADWYKYKTSDVNANINYKIGYYPNTRTDGYFGIGADYSKNYFKYTEEEPVTKEYDYVMSPYLNIGLNYYFSPQFSINASYTTEYYFKEYTQNDITYFTSRQHFRTYFNLGLVYKFF